MRYFKVTTINDWFIVIDNDLYRCKKMLNKEIVSIDFFAEWRHFNDFRNRFNEYTPKAYDEWLKQNLN